MLGSTLGRTTFEYDADLARVMPFEVGERGTPRDIMLPLVSDPNEAIEAMLRDRLACFFIGDEAIPPVGVGNPPEREGTVGLECGER